MVTVESFKKFFYSFAFWDDILILKISYMVILTVIIIFWHIFTLICLEYETIVKISLAKDLILVVVLYSFCFKFSWEDFRTFCFGKYAAYMYWTGYLSKIIPVSESVDNAELVTRIKDFEDMERIKIPIKKLFILVPISGKTEPIICKHSEMIEKRKCLVDLELNRAGVSTRKFTNTVYRLFFDNELKARGPYVSFVAEYASPLTTLVELSQVFPRCDKMTVEFMTRMFYNALNELLSENPNVGKHCIILFYDDKRMDAVTVLQDKFKEILGDSINFKMYNDTPKSNVNIKDERSLENDISSSLIHRHSLMNV